MSFTAHPDKSLSLLSILNVFVYDAFCNNTGLSSIALGISLKLPSTLNEKP